MIGPINKKNFTNYRFKAQGLLKRNSSCTKVYFCGSTTFEKGGKSVMEVLKFKKGFI